MCSDPKVAQEELGGSPCDLVHNPDVVGATLGGIEGCCRSIAAHKVTRGQLHHLGTIYDQLVVISEVIQLNGER